MPARLRDESGRFELPRGWSGPVVGAVGLALVAVGAVAVGYNACRIEVRTGEQAVLTRLVGQDLAPDMELAPPPDRNGYFKGIQRGVLTEGRYFYNPFFWSWEVRPQF